MASLVSEMKQILRWPNQQQQMESSRKFEDMCSLPGIIGALDGTHIQLAYPPAGDQSYYNRKGYPSMQLQVVVDERLMITNAYTGWPGATHDARVYINSRLHTEGRTLFLPNHYLLADSAYPLQDWIIAPFRRNVNLNQHQVQFNRALSSARQIVERCIGHLKGRFRRLREITLRDPSDICHMIIWGCILHNLCILHEPEDIGDYLEPNVHNFMVDLDHAVVNDRAGVARRNLLVQQLADRNA